MPPESPTSPTGALDNRMIAVMRLVLSASALLIIYIDPFEPDHYVALTYSLLTLYIAYCLALCGLAWAHSPLLPVTTAHWIDVMWYAVLVGLSGGAHSIFFFFFFFAILVASFRWGFAPGLRVTLVSAVLCTIVGGVMTPAESAFALNRFLLRPTSLLVLGYMMAYWGGAEIELKRRLALLKDVSALANPRFGVDRTLGTIMQQLRAFYNADACVLVTPDPSTGGYGLRRTDRRNLEAIGRAEAIDEGLARLLLALPAERALVDGGAPPRRSWRRPAVVAPTGKETTNGDSAETAPLRGILGAESFVTAPFRARDNLGGRLYLTSPRRRAFTTTDVDFLAQVLDHVVPVLENIRLIDRLASDAAEVERQRIARDLHDSVIQPYIGLQMGLAAMREKLASGCTDVRHDVDRLLKLTEVGIADLRHYTGELRNGSSVESILLPALRRFGDKFTEATGIAVQIEAAGNLHGNDRLAAEVFQMVTEGLSNIRRHTNSTQAAIGLTCGNDHLILRIENASAAPVSFTPRSLTERATAIGGRTRVECTAGSTAVIIDVPL